MISCPLMSNPDVAREFNEIKDATTEKTAYNVWSKNNGNGIDKAPNGEPSILFAALLSKFKNRVKAIRQKAKYYGNNFLEIFGNWIDDPGSVIENLDKNGEPDVEYDEDAIDRFIDKLIPRKRMYTGQKLFILHIQEFYKELLGVELRINGASSIQLLKDETEFFIFNQFDLYLDEQIKKYSSIKEDLDNIPFKNVKLLKQRLIEFLDSDNDVSEYDLDFQQLIKKAFPNLFNDKNTPQMKGWYKHVLLSSNPQERNGKQTKIRILNLLAGNNLAKYKIDAKLKKLNAIKQTIQKYPGIKSRIKRRLFNEIDLTQNRNIIPKEVAANASIENTKGDHGVFSITSMRFTTGKIYSSIQVANELKKNPKYKQIAEKIEQCLLEIGDCIIIPSDKKYTSVFYAGGENNRYSEIRDYSGVYRTNLHMIELNTSGGTFVRNPEEVIIHEMVHAITSITLDADSDIKQSIHEYMKYCLSFNISDIRDYYNDVAIYGFADEHEFIAEYFSNPEFLEYLKHIPAMDDKKFNNIFEEIFDIILRALGIRSANNAYDQIRPILLGIIDILQVTAKPNQRGISVLETEDSLLLYSIIGQGSLADAKYMRELNNINSDMNHYAARLTIQQTQKDPNLDPVESMQDAKKQWIEERQRQIIGETQLKLAEAYGLHQEVGEDGRIRFISETNDDKTNLIIDFLDYIGGDHQGYYDHNSTSSAAHHVIAISLTEGDPSTFDHELAHHYIRMFWNSKLIQTSLRAVYQEGMTNEEVEEALVDVITARTADTEFMSCVEDQSFFLKFWAALANILYTTFGIENEAIRNQLYVNITRAYALNEQQKELDAEKRLFLMYKGRVFKSKIGTAIKRGYKSFARKASGISKYRESLSKTRDENRQKDALIEYEKVNAVPIHDAISRIALGTVSRNKEFRRSQVTNPEMQVLMQIQENAVKKFIQDIKEFRQKYLRDNGLENKKRLTFSEKQLMISTQEEKEANINLISSFIETARIELSDLIEKLMSAKESEYTHYIQEEIVDPNTGDVKVQYIPATIANMQNTSLDRREFTFDDMMSMYQNVVGFYSKALEELSKALKDSEFERTYGKDITEQFLSEVSTGSASLLLIEQDIEDIFNNAVKIRIESFCVSYVQDAMKGLPDDLVQRATYSVRQWLSNQSTWGDLGGLSSFLKLPSQSMSNLVRLLLDIVDNINYETHRQSDDKAKTLRKLRKKAIKSLGFKGALLYGALSPFNFDKLFIEKDRDGYATGNFLDSVNKGLYYQDREKFIDGLLFGKDGIEKQIRQRSGDYSYEMLFDTDGEPIFPEGFEDIENDFLHKLNHWTSKHAIRPFTEEYYDLKIDMLSRKTRDALKAILSDINDIIGACTIDGKVHTELLNSSKAKQLKILYNQKSQLASIYDEFGNEKPIGSDERLIAEELMAWNDVIEGQIAYKKDTEAYEAAKAASKNPDIFEKQNSYPIMNPLIWDEIEKLSPLVGDDQIKKLRKYRNQLRHIIVNKGLLKPRIQDVWDESTRDIRAGYEGFWENLKKVDEELGKLLNDVKSAKPRTLAQKLAIDRLVRKVDIKKTGAGVWRQIIEALVKLRIKDENPGDPLWKDKFDKEMLKYKAEIKDSHGNPKDLVWLSIFTMRMPSKETTTIGGTTIQSIIREPILAYSVIDPDNSSNRFVDKRYNFNSNDLVLPLTDDTVDKNDKEQVSYTNRTYEEHIQKGTREVLNYFRALQNTMKEAYANIPFAGKYDGRLVQKSGTVRQVYLSNPWNPLRPLLYWAKRLFFVNETDTEINIDYQLRPDGTRSMNIPVRYIRRLDDPRKINTDILSSVIDFYTMSVNYKNKSKHLSEVQAILYRTEKSNPNRKGLINAIKGIINRQFYERLRVLEFNEDNGVSYKQNITKMLLKLLPLVRSLATTGLLALNWISAIVAWVDPMLLVLTEAIVGKNYNMGDYIASIFYVLKSLPSAIASIGSTTSSGILGSHTVGGMAYFNLGRTVNERYSRMDRSRIGRFIGEDIVMRPFSLGEYTVNAQIYEIVMHQYKAVENMDTHKLEFMKKRDWLLHAYDHGIDLNTARKQWHKNFNTLHSAYHIDKRGNFARKRNELGALLTDEFEKLISKEMRSKSTIANLIVPHTERTGLQTNIVAAFVSVMRTFLLVAISERAKSLHDFQIDDPSSADETTSIKDRAELKKEYWRDKGGFNFQTRTIEDGMWRGFWTFLWHTRYYKYAAWRLIHPFKSTIDQDVKDKKERLQIADTDLYGMNRFLTEVGIFLFFMCADIAWHNKMVGDGDDDKYGYQLLSHLLTRIAIVRMTFFSPDTLNDLITSVTAATTDILNKLSIIDLLQDVYAGYSQHGWNFDEWEKVKGQSAYKGKPKALRSLFKTLSGLGLHSTYSSSSVDGLKTKTKWYNRMNKWKSLYDEKEKKPKEKQSKPTGRFSNDRFKSNRFDNSNRFNSRFD